MVNTRPAGMLRGAAVLVSGLALAAITVVPANAKTTTPAPAPTPHGPVSKSFTTASGDTVKMVFGAPASVPAGGSFMLRNLATNGCADLPNFGSVPANTPVTQYTRCTTSESADNQDWHALYTRTSPDGAPLYEIQNDKSGLCMDLPNYGPDAPGTPVSVYPCATAHPDQDNQEWALIEFYFNGVDEGTLIENYMSTPGFPTSTPLGEGQCLDVSGWHSNGTDLGNGKALTIYNCAGSGWDYWGTDDHLWYGQGATG
jgi:hypothetical protein